MGPLRGAPSRCPARSPFRGPTRSMLVRCPYPARRPRLALKYLRAPEPAGLGRAAAPHVPPRKLRGAAAGFPSGLSPRRARPGGRRRRSLQSTAPPPSARLCQPAAARPHNGSGRSLTYPDQASVGPALGSPQDPTCPQDPSPGAPRIAGGGGRRGGCTALNSHNPSNTLLHLAFSHPSLSLRSPGGDPLRTYKPLQLGHEIRDP